MEGEMNTKLIDECWEMVFNKLSQGSDWDSVSLVSKQFLSVTNSSRVSLTVFSESVQVLSRQLQRFRYLKKIQLSNFSGDINEAVLQIARSGLSLEELDLSSNENLPTVSLEELGSGLKNLKALNCSGSSLTDADLFRIADSFPQLEELQIRNSYFPHIVDGKIIAVTDEGIEYLSSRLMRLRKIDLSGNPCISDKSLISLASYCANLDQVIVGHSGRGLTEFGVRFLLETSHKLTSFVLWARIEIGSIFCRGPAYFYKNLQSLKFVNVKISDEFLHSITEAHIQLNELTLTCCESYTFTGIYMLLRSFRSLKSLCLECAEYLTDVHIEALCPYLQHLTSLLLYYSKLSGSGFVMITQSCPLLTHLHLVETSLGKDDFNYDGHIKNSAVTYLDISANPYLNSSCLRKLLAICPNVEKLNLFKCFQHEQLDIAEILERASEIKSLDLNCCRCLNFVGAESATSKLERLVAKHSRMDDEVLDMIARSCPSLLHLDLEDCEKVTEEGVKEIARYCQRLRYLSLSDCYNVNPDVINWIVSNRPSLRRIVSSSYEYPDEDEQRHFLQLGCIVSKEVDYEELI